MILSYDMRVMCDEFLVNQHSMNDDIEQITDFNGIPNA